MDLQSSYMLSPGRERYFSPAWVPDDLHMNRAKRTTGRNASVRWVHKWGWTLDLSYHCLFSISFKDWSGWGKVASLQEFYSGTILKLVFWNMCQNSCSACKTHSVLPDYASCYRACMYFKHWQLSVASFVCSETSCDRHRWSAAPGVSGHITEKRLESNLSLKMHVSREIHNKISPNRKKEHCFSLELQVLLCCITLVCHMSHKVSLNKTFKSW